MTVFGLTSEYVIGMAAWCLGLALAVRMLLMIRRSGREKNGRMTLANAGLSLWLLLTVFTLTELGFAIGYDRTDSFSMSNVSRKWYRKYAGREEKWVQWGSGEAIAYRDDRPFPKVIPDGAKHISFLGDSFTYGHGINYSADRFSNLVGSQLAAESPGGFVVTNLSRPGADLFWGEAWLKVVFEAGVRVDVVVFALNLNDIESFHSDFGTQFSKIERTRPDFFLFRDSYFFNLIYFRLRQARLPQLQKYYDFVREYYSGEPWVAMQAKLRDLKKLCSDNGCEFRIVIFPFLHDLDGDYSFGHAHAKIGDFCRGAEIPVLDLLPVLQPHAQEGLVVSPFDAHPNERANRYAAEAIRDWLPY